VYRRSRPSTARQCRGLWGQALRDEMENYNHQLGQKWGGAMLPSEANRLTLAGAIDRYGLAVLIHR
jgi:hypothetical protein